jgi:hypothetical protein
MNTTTPGIPSLGHSLSSQDVDNPVDMCADAVEIQGKSPFSTWTVVTCAPGTHPAPTTTVDNQFRSYLHRSALSTVSTNAMTKTSPSMTHDDPQHLPGPLPVEGRFLALTNSSGQRARVSATRARMNAINTHHSLTTHRTSGGLVLRGGR